MKVMRILLVDDDSFLRDMYATKFVESNHEVEAAENGTVALQLLQEKSFDVVLLDMVMPGMTGIEFLEKVKNEDYSKKTRFVVLSNQGEESDKAKATDAGAEGYIIKAELIPSEVVKKVEGMMA